MKRWGGRASRRLTAQTLATYGDVCVLCGLPGADSAGHVLPRSWVGREAGGRVLTLAYLDSLDNLRPTHLGCNQAHGAQPMATSYRRPAEDALSTWPVWALSTSEQAGTP